MTTLPIITYLFTILQTQIHVESDYFTENSPLFLRFRSIAPVNEVSLLIRLQKTM